MIRYFLLAVSLWIAAFTSDACCQDSVVQLTPQQMKRLEEHAKALQSADDEVLARGRRFDKVTGVFICIAIAIELIVFFAKRNNPAAVFRVRVAEALVLLGYTIWHFSVHSSDVSSLLGRTIGSLFATLLVGAFGYAVGAIIRWIFEAVLPPTAVSKL